MAHPDQHAEYCGDCRESYHGDSCPSCGKSYSMAPVNSDPAVDDILQYFEFKHLPPHLQEISAPISALAKIFASQLEGREVVAGLRKLMEAKDCFVRARLSMPVLPVESKEPCVGCGELFDDHPNESGCQQWHE